MQVYQNQTEKFNIIFRSLFFKLVSTTAIVTAAHVFIKNNQFLQPPDILVSVGRASLQRG